MKYLLVLQPVSMDRTVEFYMPLGLPYVNGAMRSKGFDVEAVNLQYVDGDPIECLKNMILEKEIDAVLCGGLTTQYQQIKEVFDAARSVNPRIITIGGGGGYSSEPILFSEMTNVDYAVIGEGEITNCELAEALDCGKSPDSILGLVIKKENGYVYTGERPYIRDLDSVPFPSYEGFCMDEYLEQQRADGWYHTYAFYSDDPRLMPMCLARSCPFSCKFCYHPIGRGYRSRSLDNFFEELDLWIEKYHINGIVLIDECFSIKPERVLEFCRRIKPYHLAWGCQMRVETYSEELIQAMTDAGCISACFGLESMSQKILTEMNKKTTTEQLQKALDISYRCAGGSLGNLIFGSAAEDEESLAVTAKWREENPEFNLANYFMVGAYPGSEYYNDAVRKGIIKDKKKFIEEGCPFVNITKLSDKKYAVLEAYAYLKDIEIQHRGKIVSMEETADGINAVLECWHCGHRNEFRRIRKKRYVNGILKLKTMSCKKCHNFSDYVSEGSSYKESWNTAKWLLDWLTDKENHKLEDFMKSRKYRKVAIYGMGLAAKNLADFFMEELEKIHVEIAYGIDRRAELFSDAPVPVYGPDDELPAADAVLVVPVYYFNEIASGLRKRTDMDIVSLEEIFA